MKKSIIFSIIISAFAVFSILAVSFSSQAKYDKASNNTVYSSNLEAKYGSVFLGEQFETSDDSTIPERIIKDGDFVPVWETKKAEELEPGLYGTQGELIETWESLLESKKVVIEEHGGVNCLFCTDKSIGPVLVVEDGIWFIGGFFSCYNLQAVYMPKSIKQIGNCAFKDCINLKHIRLDGEKINIGIAAFAETAIENINFMEGQEIIPELAFEYCLNLKYVEVPESVVVIGLNAFQFCENIDTIYLPASVLSFPGFDIIELSSMKKIVVDKDSFCYKKFCNEDYYKERIVVRK